MTQEALKLALDALETELSIDWGNQDEFNKSAEKMHEAIKVIKEALAQEQEPVGDDWTPCMKLPVVVYVRKQRFGESHVSTREGITPVKPDDLIMRGVSGEEYPIGRAIFEQTYSLNTTTPQRTWVELEGEEIRNSWEEATKPDRSTMTMVTSFARAIEAKLKEKNT
jgi:hypothetical protein